MTSIAVRSIAVADEHGGGSAYEWEVLEDGRIVRSGVAPTMLEAAMHAGNAVYDVWGYAEGSGRLAIVGEKAQVLSREELSQMFDVNLSYERSGLSPTQDVSDEANPA
jgi:hypothetical protein